jgi:hypothetical protein
LFDTEAPAPTENTTRILAEIQAAIEEKDAN